MGKILQQGGRLVGMKKSFFQLVATLCLILPCQTMAIGMGDIAVSSFINQPLEAQISVLQPEGLVESEVLVGLASVDAFERLGLERHYSLNDLKFVTDFSQPSRPVVAVTTDEPILEPYLSFLLELKWPEGRVLREYTIFLDLPPSAARDFSSRVQTDDQQRGFGEISSAEYRVAPNDTLGAIAAALKPSSLSIDQMMLAIKAANPDSFLRGNINGIRAGVLLTIPSDFSDVPNARAASAEVAQEWERWKLPRRGLRIVADNELLDASVVNDQGAVDNAATETENGQGTARPEAAITPTSASTNDLASIEARLSALSDQLTDIQAVVESKDAEIARLKAELAERPVRGAATQPPESAESEQTLVSTPPNNSGAVSSVLWFIAAMGLAAIAWFNRNRFMPRRQDTSDNEGMNAPSALTGGLDELLPVSSQAGSQADNEHVSGAERGYGESLLTGYAADQTLADAVAEADIYVAYGRHQHALDTLEAASAAEPNNAAGLLKMLDIYMSLDRVDEAISLLSLVEATGDSEALDNARSLLDAHQVALSGDDAAHTLASFDEPQPVAEAMGDTLDISLDLEFQEAAKPSSDAAESDTAATGDIDDPAETALDLALAYIDMGDKAGAAELLQTVLSAGDEAQREHAQSLLDSLK
jgi:pilus assembly protein FimV